MVPNFSLRQLGYLVAVADTGSMTAAAAAQHVSQAAISAGIIDLERRLGVQLLARRPGHGASLTEAGLAVVADARRTLAAAADVVASARVPGSALRGSLTLGCYASLAPLYLPPLHSTFAAEHPAVELSVVEGSQEALRKALMNGTCELALTYDSGLGPGLNTQLIRTLKPYVLLSADHPFAGRASVSFADLADEPLITYALEPSLSNNQQLLRKFGVTPRIVHSSPNIEVVRSLVARGLGYTLLLHRWPSQVSIEGLALACVPLGGDVPDYDVVAAWPQQDRLSRRASAVVAFLRGIAHELPGSDLERPWLHGTMT
jgi:DNA-binding transcriptional LysR family regulator